MAERVLCVLVAAFGVACLVRARRAPASSRSPLAIGPRAERTAMLVVIGWVLLTRLVGATSPHQPRWYFSQVEPLHIADALARGHLGRQWLDLLKNVQVIWEHESPLQAPVATVMQLLLGPSIELPTFVGAVWAVLAVLLAWRLGRSIESPAFGVLFAALLAVSPLQITWARLGGIYIGASAAVLFALWIGFRAGMCGSVAAAAAVGVVAWTAVYHYFAARVGMGLAFVALWAGWRRSGRGTGRLVALVTAAALGLGACMLWHRAVNPAQSLWPAYQGYVGSHGETSVQDWLASSAAAIRAQGERVLRAYFWAGRLGVLASKIASAPSPWLGTLRQPGMAGGGLVLLPVLLLGAVGMLRCLRHPVERGLWLVLAVCGLLPSLLGVPSARRLLVLDVAWCALAALGLLGIVGSRFLSPATSSGRWRVAGGVLAAIAVWSAAAVGLSAAIVPPNQIHIPFGDSGFGDGSTCLGCVRTARIWQQEMAQGRMVILFDTDVYRENPTAPGGLSLYGKTAALAAGNAGRFLDYYAIVSNFDRLPPRPGPFANVAPEDVARDLGARIEAAAPSAIVWWFTQPTAWERWLAKELVVAGSSRTDPAPVPMWGADRPILAAPPIRIETPWERRQDALAVIHRLVDPPMPAACVRLVPVATRNVPLVWPTALAPVDSGASPPTWAVGRWNAAEIFGTERPARDPLWFQYGRNRDGSARVDLIEFWGAATTWTQAGDERHSSAIVPGPRPLGRDCAVLQDGAWWVVDPVGGTLNLAGNPPLSGAGEVVGITQLGERLVLATADQRLLVPDPTGGRAPRAVPAVVAPSRRFHFGECSMVVAGRDWIASYDQPRGVLFVYDRGGAPLGRIPLARAMGTQPRSVHTIRAAGDYLGVGHDTAVTTLRVVRDATCASPDAGEPE